MLWMFKCTYCSETSSTLIVPVEYFLWYDSVVRIYWHFQYNLSVLLVACSLLFCSRQVVYSDEDRKFNREITVGLIRSELINLTDYNLHLTKWIDGGRNSMSF